MKKSVAFAVGGTIVGALLLVKAMPKLGYLTDAGVILIAGGALFWVLWISHRRQQLKANQVAESLVEIAQDMEPDQQAKLFKLVRQLNSQANAAAVLEARGALRTGLRPGLFVEEETAGPPEAA